MTPVGLDRVLRRRRGGGPRAPSLLSLSPVVWYRADLSSTDDGNGKLGACADLSGHGRNASAAPLSNRLLLSTSTAFGAARRCWKSSSTSQYYGTPSWPATTNPLTFFLVFAAASAASNFVFFYDGVDVTNRIAEFLNAIGTPKQVGFYGSGVQVNGNTDYTAATGSVHVWELNGASSVARVNGAQVATGNTGTVTTTGQTVANRYTLGVGNANCEYFEFAVIPGAGGSVRAAIELYAKQVYPSVMP